MTRALGDARWGVRPDASGSRIVVWDDFLFHGAGTGGWQYTGTGKVSSDFSVGRWDVYNYATTAPTTSSLAALAIYHSISDPLGLAELRSGADPDEAIGVCMYQTRMWGAPGIMDDLLAEVAIRVKAPASTVTGDSVWFGLQVGEPTTLAAAPVTGASRIGFRCKRGTDTTNVWSAVHASGAAAETTTSITGATTTEWRTLRLRWLANGNVEFLVDGTVAYTATSNVPTDTSNDSFFLVSHTGGAGKAASATLAVDYWLFECNRL
jgi:hypothetical protein